MADRLFTATEGAAWAEVEIDSRMRLIVAAKADIASWCAVSPTKKTMTVYDHR